MAVDIMHTGIVTLDIRDRNNRSTALERSVMDYWGGVLNMIYWIQTLALCFCSGSKHLVRMNVS